MCAAQIRALATHVKVNHDEAVICARKLAQELLHAVYIHLARSGTAREAHTARGCRVSFRRYPPARRTARPVSDPRAMRRWGFISLRTLQRRLALRGPRRPHGGKATILAPSRYLHIAPCALFRRAHRRAAGTLQLRGRDPQRLVMRALCRPPRFPTRGATERTCALCKARRVSTASKHSRRAAPSAAPSHALASRLRALRRCYS